MQNHRHTLKVFSILSCLLFSNFSLLAQEAEKPAAPTSETSEKNEKVNHFLGFVELNLYPYDTRDLSVFTVNTLANLPAGFQYFSFVNFESNMGGKNNDLQNFYSEQDLYWNFMNKIPFDIVSEWVIASGSSDALREGLKWKLAQTPVIQKALSFLNMWYDLYYFPLQVDSVGGYNWQIQHVYGIQLFPKWFKDRAYLSGFADHNWSKWNQTWVTEHQIGIRLVDSLYAIAEYRYNDYTPKKQGVGLGIEYKIKFNSTDRHL